MAVYNDAPSSNYSWADSSVQGTIKFNGTTGNSGLVARYVDVVGAAPTNYYYLRLNATNNRIELVKVGTTTTTVLAYSPETIVSGTDYKLKFYLYGSTLKGYLNGVERLSISDDEFTLGSAGIRSEDQGISVDDFMATRIMYSDDLESGNAR
ncbi:hypothetical protein [Paenibacillus qinlingensis]|uniref:hypothetical protein n=1 Tax=Paenibacillus qinlingensis TaxID=1837343 RepID=UPI0015668D8C|nr:hypothetical protein [Paenibacillus qinlingensis]NQX61357.1 hypothetical protein [Paenibacillus qinlingensis]